MQLFFNLTKLLQFAMVIYLCIIYCHGKSASGNIWTVSYNSPQVVLMLLLL